jgi:FolB domain-containing protein
MSEIRIKSLRVPTYIGVPDEERSAPQEVEIDILIAGQTSFREMGDDILRTVDYAEVCEKVARLAAEKPRRLIETLADEVATMIIRDYPAKSADVEVRKFILPNTECVSVRCIQVRK